MQSPQGSRCTRQHAPPYLHLVQEARMFWLDVDVEVARRHYQYDKVVSVVVEPYFAAGAVDKPALAG